MANYCAHNHFYSNGNIQYDKSFKENIENILQTFGGVLYESNGKYYLTVDAPDIPSVHFDETNIGSVNITTGSKSDYFNTMDSTYTNPGNDYSQDIIRYPSDAISNASIAKDGYIIKKDLNYLGYRIKISLLFLVTLNCLNLSTLRTRLLSIPM
jgi:hypothetical protein